jgi:hypothetical protein
MILGCIVPEKRTPEMFHISIRSPRLLWLRDCWKIHMNKKINIELISSHFSIPNCPMNKLLKLIVQVDTS